MTEQGSGAARLAISGTITKTKKREVRIWRDGPYVIVKERNHSEPSQWAQDRRRKWSDDRVALTDDELRLMVSRLGDI